MIKNRIVTTLMLALAVAVSAPATAIAQAQQAAPLPAVTESVPSSPGNIVVDGVKYPTVQSAIDALPPSGGTVMIPPGTYSGPTRIPSGTRLVSMGNILPPQIWNNFNGSDFNSFTAGPGSLNMVQFKYQSSLIISDVSQIGIDGVILNFAGAGGLILQGVSQSDFSMALVGASAKGPAIELIGGTAFSTQNNRFDWLITEGGNAGVQIGSTDASLRYPSLNRFGFVFVLADLQPAGTFTALNLVANCDSNFFNKVQVWGTPAITNYRGIVFNSGSTTTDAGADNEYIGWYDETLAGPPDTSVSITVDPESGAFFRTGVLNSKTKLVVTAWANTSTYTWERMGDNAGGGNGFGSQMMTVGALLINAGTPSLFFQKANSNRWDIYTDSSDNLNFVNGSSRTLETIFQAGGHSFVEQSSRSGMPGQDVCYGDSADHALKCSYNNGSFGTICLSNGCPGAVATGKPSLVGCKLSISKGGAWAGSFQSGTAGRCTVTINPGLAAPNGWTCDAHDLTNVADAINQVAYTATTATISGNAAKGDTITWKCAAW